MLTLNQIDTLPVELGTHVAALALQEGPERLGAAKRLAKAERPEIRELIK